MAVKACQIYGVITKVLPNGELAVCEPVFNSISRKGPKKLYKAIWKFLPMPNRENQRIIEYFEPVDISEFGVPLFLPVSKSKINDGKEHLILYQDSKSIRINRSGIVLYHDSPMVCSLRSNDDWLPNSVTVGILFPDKFITVMLGGLNVSELKELIEESFSKQ